MKQKRGRLCRADMTVAYDQLGEIYQSTGIEVDELSVNSKVRGKSSFQDVRCGSAENRVGLSCRSTLPYTGTRLSLF